MSVERFLRSRTDVRTTGKADEVCVCCPFCSDDRFHGYFNLRKQVYICFRCHARQSPGRRGYSGYWFLRRVYRLSHDEAVAVLGDRKVGSRLPAAEPHGLGEIPWPSGLSDLDPDAASAMGRAAWRYLTRRLGPGRARDYCERYGLRYGYAGEYAGRLVLPVFEAGRLVFYQGRSFWPVGAEPKYLNPTTSQKPLMGALGEGGHLILVEGWFDAANLGEAAVAVFGSIVTPDQLRRIVAARPASVTVAFDPDEAGRDGAVAAARRLRAYVADVRVARLECEPSDLPPEDAAAVWAASRPAQGALLSL